MRRLHLTLLVAVTLSSADAHAEPETSHQVHLKSESHVTTAKGSVLDLPPGYWLDEQTWQDKDAELKKLQEQSTRLTAENTSLKQSADEISFGWKSLSTIAVLAFTGGYLLAR